MKKYSLAVDIGGTFTDAVLLTDDGQAWTDKTLTTHSNLLQGFFTASELVLGRAGITLSEVSDVVTHATTIVTNVLIERKGVRTGLITTQGFGDVLYIRDEHRYDMFDPQIEYAEPLVTRDNTWEIEERIFADGSVGQPVNEAQLRTIAQQMNESGVASVAVCLLNSYANPRHEKEVGEALQALAPDLHVTLSSDIAPQMREYLRASTACVNAYAVPTSKPYLEALIDRMRDQGLVKEPMIMLSNGGVVGARTAGSNPVRMIESGPAAGALVAGFTAKKYGINNLISFDMGGTTAKACLIQNGEPLVTGDFEVDRRYRFKPGSGMPVTVPSIDMIEIGAGGGSVARVNELGLLKVGPDSAGSDPGPVCYGRGGELPCVTDADLVLGIIDPDKFLGGDMPLDISATRVAIGKLADKLKVTAEEAAYGVFSVVGESMAAAARAHATDRGVNYRGLPLLAFGGAGPVHACYVAEQLESSQVIFPRMASVLSAFGTLVTPARLDLARSALMRLGELDWTKVDQQISAMMAEGKTALLEAGLPPERINHSYAVDMRYVGQQTEVTVSLDDDPRENRDIADLRARFETAYEVLYGLTLDDMDVEVVVWRVTAHGGDTNREVDIVLPGKHAEPTGSRQIYYDRQFMDVAVYDRDELAGNQRVDGPVIVEERETTIFILPEWRLAVHADGSLAATRKEA